MHVEYGWHNCTNRLLAHTHKIYILAESPSFSTASPSAGVPTDQGPHIKRFLMTWCHHPSDLQRHRVPTILLNCNTQGQLTYNQPPCRIPSEQKTKTHSIEEHYRHFHYTSQQCVGTNDMVAVGLTTNTAFGKYLWFCRQFLN